MIGNSALGVLALVVAVLYTPPDSGATDTLAPRVEELEDRVYITHERRLAALESRRGGGAWVCYWILDWGYASDEGTPHSADRRGWFHAPDAAGAREQAERLAEVKAAQWADLRGRATTREGSLSCRLISPTATPTPAPTATPSASPTPSASAPFRPFPADAVASGSTAPRERGGSRGSSGSASLREPPRPVRGAVHVGRGARGQQRTADLQHIRHALCLRDIDARRPG